MRAAVDGVPVMVWHAWLAVCWYIWGWSGCGSSPFGVCIYVLRRVFVECGVFSGGVAVCCQFAVLFGTLCPDVWKFLFISFGWVMGSVAADINCAGWVGWFVYLGFMAGAESLSPRVGLCLGKLQGRRWGPSGCFHFFFCFPFLLFPFTLLIL